MVHAQRGLAHGRALLTFNPRTANGNRRRKLRARMAALGLPCALCGQPIDYSLGWWVDPADGRRKRHPMSFEVDEIVPVALGGDPLDWRNLQPAHRACNQRKGKRMGFTCAPPAAPARPRREGGGPARGAGPGAGGAEGGTSVDW